MRDAQSANRNMSRDGKDRDERQVPLLPQLVAVLLDLSERHLEARQLGFSRLQLGH
jgi:hypothetical protein